jgi:hypothetical protein
LSFKLLVIGDSFACYDDTQSHWAAQWMLNKGGTTTHIGIGGSNAVNIVNEFEYTYRSTPWDFDAAVFHVPDFVRTEVTVFGRPSHLDNPINRVNLYYALDHTSMMEHVINGEQNLLPQDVRNFYYPYLLESVQLPYFLHELDPESERTQQFKANYTSYGVTQYDLNMMATAASHYNTASSRWLTRANYHALKNFNLQMQLNNKPVCFILNPYLGPEKLAEYRQHFTGLSNIWRMDVISENVGENHVSLENARICAKQFDSYNKHAKIFPI